MHRVSPESRLAKRVRMEAWREGQRVVALDTGAAKSALTECAFSWKFALTEFL